MIEFQTKSIGNFMTMLLLLVLLITSTDCEFTKNDKLSIISKMNEHRLSVNDKLKPLTYNEEIDQLGTLILSKCPKTINEIDEKNLGFIFLIYDKSTNYKTPIDQQWFKNKIFITDGCKTTDCPEYKEIISEDNIEVGCALKQCNDANSLICLFTKKNIQNKNVMVKVDPKPPNPKPDPPKPDPPKPDPNPPKPNPPKTTISHASGKKLGTTTGRSHVSSTAVVVNYGLTVKIFSCIIILFYFLLK